MPHRPKKKTKKNPKKTASDTLKPPDPTAPKMPHEPLSKEDVESILLVIDGWTKTTPVGGLEQAQIINDLIKKMGRIHTELIASLQAAAKNNEQ